MNKFKTAAAILTIVALCGCATPYKPAGTFRNGYSDTRVDQNTAIITFKGNGATSEDKVQLSMLRRCAEVTLQANYDYFVIQSFTVKELESTSEGIGYYDTDTIKVKDKDGHKATVERDVYVPGDTVTTVRYKENATIKMYNGKKPSSNAQAYDARELMANTAHLKKK